MSRETCTWRELLALEMRNQNETADDVVSGTLTEAQLDRSFDYGYGGTEGIPFTVWTADRVYFPGAYDGSEWVASVARNPDGVPTPHVGG